MDLNFANACDGNPVVGELRRLSRYAFAPRTKIHREHQDGLFPVPDFDKSVSVGISNHKGNHGVCRDGNHARLVVLVQDCHRAGFILNMRRGMYHPSSVNWKVDLMVQSGCRSHERWFHSQFSRVLQAGKLELGEITRLMDEDVDSSQPTLTRDTMVRVALVDPTVLASSPVSRWRRLSSLRHSPRWEIVGVWGKCGRDWGQIPHHHPSSPSG